jgi:Tol biopolymer transport system component
VNPDGTNEFKVREWFVTAEAAEPTLSPQAWWVTGAFIYMSLKPNLGLGNPERIWYVEVATGNATEAVPPRSTHPSISSAGWIAYSSDNSGTHDIYIVNPQGEGFLFTSGPAQDRYPTWSPDGEQILFASNRTGNWEIYIANRNGTGLTNLTDHPADQIQPYWVP